MVEIDRWAVDRALQLQNELKEAYEEYSFLTVFQKVVQFCGVDLGGFYLDIIKDRQYTTAKDSVARRSCQTAMYHILEAMTRWIAPVLSFTADEIWTSLPKPKGSEREVSVFVCEWYEGLEALEEDDQKGRAFWLQILAVKNAVNKRIEEERNAGNIKGALATEVSLFCEGDLYDALLSLGDELRFVLITSGARVLPVSAAEGAQAKPSELDGLLLEIHASAHAKCDRCWHHREDVGQHAKHPELCGRCIENIEGDGEQRAFA
jgi:isoleucyl-tRNA synthetase